MFVCRECHEKDRRVTGCSILFDVHSNRIMSTCDLCGKTAYVSECWRYDRLKREEQERCSSVENATK